MKWLLDLDGVVWRGNVPIEGSIDALRQLRTTGIETFFVTNNSMLGASDMQAKLKGLGFDTQVSDFISARELLVETIGSGKRVLCAAGDGLAAAIRDGGNEVWTVAEFAPSNGQIDAMQPPPEVDFVAVGQRIDLTYLQLSVATQALLQCKNLVAPNRDPLYPSEHGMLLGSGSLVATLERSSGVTATVVGKPERPMVQHTKERLPDVDLIVGDQLETDGELARKLAVDFAYVASGVGEQRGNSGFANTPIAHKAADLAELVRNLA